MAFREIIPDLNELTDPVGEPVESITSPLQRLELPKNTNLSLKRIGTGIAGLVMLWFGATTAGSYFVAASRFKGILATVFYEWQVASVIAMIGLILLYHSISWRE